MAENIPNYLKISNNGLSIDFENIAVTVATANKKEWAKEIVKRYNNTNEEREKDIQKLASSVLNMSPDCWDNPNGPYETKCPFCYVVIKRGGEGEIWASMAELKHKTNCVYLVAKDLSAKK